MSRPSVEAARGPGHHDHVGWAYDEPAEFRWAVAEFLAEGLALGLRVCYVADGDPAALCDDLVDLRDLVDLGTTNPAAVQVQSLGERYTVGSVMDPVGQVQAFVAATEAALGAGFAGLRVAGEVTSLVRTPDQLDAMARYEHLIDRCMTTRPLSGLCGYHRAELSEQFRSKSPGKLPTATRARPATAGSPSKRTRRPRAA